MEVWGGEGGRWGDRERGRGECGYVVVALCDILSHGKLKYRHT